MIALKILHMRQPDERAARTPKGAGTPVARSSQRLPSSNSPRLVQNQKSAPASSAACDANDAELSPHWSAARTFSCSMRRRRKEAIWPSPRRACWAPLNWRNTY